MSLRLRLALTILGAAAVATPGLVVFANHQSRLAQVEIVRDYVLDSMEDWGREQCRKAPARFMGGGHFLRGVPGAPGPGFLPWAGNPAMMNPVMARNLERFQKQASRWMGPEELRISTSFWAYREDFGSENPLAPPFPEALRRRLEAGAELACDEDPDPRDSRVHHRIGIRTPWPHDPCAFLLVHHLVPEGRDGHARVLGLAGLGLLLLLAVLLSLLPVERRIRDLIGAIRGAAQSRYQEPVPEIGRDEVAAIARAFNDAASRIRAQVADLERRDEALRAFIANTTHDVMHPLTVLKGHIAALESRLASREPIPVEMVADCHRETDYLASILHNLAAVAKLEGADFHPRMDLIELGALVERVVARFRPAARVAGVQIEHAGPARPLAVRGDITLLEQALGNVIQNAIRYNRPGGHAAVILDTLDEGSRFSLRVVDDGPGVSEVDLPRLVERRFRSKEARDRNPHGLGIGLSIAHDVARRHGFELEIRRAVEGGLEAEFTGPAALDAAQPAATLRTARS